MTCKNACRWGIPANILDGGKMRPVTEIKLAIKRTAKGPEKDRLAMLLHTQSRMCWTCGHRCTEGEAAGLSHAAGNKTA